MSPNTCEVQIDDAWLEVALAEAHRLYRDRPKRCPVCGGAARTTGGYTFGGRASLMHVSSESARGIEARGCSTANAGTPVLHG